MITTLGTILILAPFSLVVLFKDKRKGLLVIFSVVACFHVFVALATQASGWFTYPVVISIHVATAATCLWILRKKTEEKGMSLKGEFGAIARRFSFKKMLNAWFPISCAVLAVYLLLSLHYNFSGRVDSISGLRTVTHSSYSYPLYSDEWVGVAFVEYSMQHASLPIVNPLDLNRPFPNFLFVSHSLIAELMMSLGMNPLGQYVQVGMINACLVLILLYAIMRKLEVRQSIAAVAAFSALLLTNSGNLPGLWFLIPYTVSLTFLLASMLAAISSSRDWRIFYLLTGLTLLLYPPMIIFIVPMIIASLSHFRQMFIKAGRLKISYVALIAGLAVLCSLLFAILFMIKGFALDAVVFKGISYLIRNPLDMGRVYYAPWNIFPWHLIPFVVIGMLIAWKSKVKLLMYPVAVGAFMWILYSFVDTVIVIEPSRVVVIVSVLCMIAAGLGFEKTYALIRKKIKNGSFDLEDQFLSNGIKVILLVFLIVWTVNISMFGMWHRMPLYFNSAAGSAAGQKLIPASPITRYLSLDDLRLFAPYKAKRFISTSWKGLVIGAATGNYPVDSKSATITNRILSYETFDSATCEEKTALAQKHGISLAYGREFHCDSFVEVGVSDEGMHLYEFKVTKTGKSTGVTAVENSTSTTNVSGSKK